MINLDELDAAFALLEAKVDAGSLLAIEGAGHVIEGEWRERVKTVDVRDPAIDTGEYAADLKTDVRSAIGGVEGEVGTSLDYPVDLEYGTWKMEAQPTGGPAFEAKQDEALATVVEILKTAVQA